MENDAILTDLLGNQAGSCPAQGFGAAGADRLHYEGAKIELIPAPKERRSNRELIQR